MYAFLLALVCLIHPKLADFCHPLPSPGFFLHPLAVAGLWEGAFAGFFLEAVAAARPLHVSSSQLFSCNQRFLGGWN